MPPQPPPPPYGPPTPHYPPPQPPRYPTGPNHRPPGPAHGHRAPAPQPAYDQPPYDQAPYDQPAYDQPAYDQRHIPAQRRRPPAAAAPRNGLGIAAIVLGPIGVLFGLIPLTAFIAIVCGLIGAILGIIGVGRVRSGQATNGAVSWIGVVLSAAAVGLGIFGLVIVGQAVDQLGRDLDAIGAPAGTPGSDAVLVEVAAGQPATTSDGVTVTAGPLESVEVEYLGEYGCSTVTYQNGGQEQARYAEFDWKLQNPQGAAVSVDFTGRDGALGTGELAPGGTVSGQVCFKDVGSGRHVLILEQLVALAPDRLTWTVDVP